MQVFAHLHGFYKNPYMHRLITEIAEHCHTAATKRGKNTSCVGCMQYLYVELAEYWKAVTIKICEN